MRKRLTRLVASRRAAWLAALALIIALVGSPMPAAEAQTGPEGERGTRAVTVAPFIAGLEEPIFATHAGDGTNRMFVVERRGTIRVLANGQLQSTFFLDIRNEVTAVIQTEQGLLGMAFHPDFESNGRFYVFLTPPPPTPNPDNLVGYNAVYEYRVTTPGSNQANPSTKRVLFSIPDRASNHNGGMLAFGPDRLLYVSIGDEGTNPNNAQNLGNLFGKILRIDVDGRSPGLQYSIPPTNPFVGRAGARPEIWAYGLRNPFRFSFDRATGDLWIGDVGQNQREEVDLQRASAGGGQNYGWPIMEGFNCFNATTCDRTGLTLPVTEYSHDFAAGGGCSISGGYVYRGTLSPGLTGAYLYADYCTGKIMTLRQVNNVWTSTMVLDTPYNITAFAEDRGGEVYVANGGRGSTGLLARVIDDAAAPVSCIPRPRVGVQVARTGTDEVQVTVTSQTNGGGTTNALRLLEFGPSRNARIVIGGGEQLGNFAQPLPGGTTRTTFTVRRAGPGGLTVPLTVVDGCGGWPTFVGLGA